MKETSEKKVIGRGTWIDKIAYEMLEKEKTLGRKHDVIRTESGLGASGFPHVGSIADCARAYAIKLAVEDFGLKSEYIAFSDDMDGLRKVPAGLPEDLEKYLGYPVSSIPDPFSCHTSYGEHMSSLLIDALDKCGIEYRFISATKSYKEGLYTTPTETILANSKLVGEIIQRELSQEKYVDQLPYFPVCAQCGRIYTTKAREWIPKEGKITYKCEGVDLRGRWLEGCHYEGESDYRKGNGKLSWKVEFAARWTALDINFEAYGKDISDSVRANDKIMEEVLHAPSPHHVRYEMFLDKGGKKISKSAGNVFTPQVWLRYGSPQSLLLLMYKRIVGTREISVFDIPRYMDELIELEKVYTGESKVNDQKELEKLKGLYEYCWLLKPPKERKPRIPYNLLVYLARVAPKGSESAYIKEKLKGYGHSFGFETKDLERQMEYAKNWAKDFSEIGEIKIELNEQGRSALKDLVEFLQGDIDEKTVQNSIFNIAKERNIEPKQLFEVVYRILVGQPRGPRLGPYIVAMGRKNVQEALQRAIATPEKA
jgi:lysyl-tRNA synthetase class 1